MKTDLPKEIEKQGMAAFESKDNLLKWLNSPCVAFGGKIPISILDTKSGVDMVIDELVRIEHGIFA